MATTKSKRLRSCASRPQCPPNKYPAPQIAVTQTAAPKKLNRTNFRHGMCSAPASSEASTRMPKMNRARKTVAAPYSLKQPICPRHRFRTNREHMPVAFDQRTPAVPPQSKTELPAHRRRHDPDQNDPGKPQSMFGIGQKARQQQNRFPRQRRACILQQQHRGHSPIPVMHQRAPQQIEDVVTHD